MKVGDRVVLRTTDSFNGQTGTIEVIRKGTNRDGFLVYVDARERGGYYFNRAEVELERARPTLSDGSDRVVFVGDSPIQIVFPDKPVLELTTAEAVQVLRQLDAVLL